MLPYSLLKLKCGLMRRTNSFILVVCIIINYLFIIFAISDGLEGWFSLHWFFSQPIAFVLALIPILGSLVAAYTVVVWWNWSWFAAVLTVAAPVIIGLLTRWNSKREI